MSRHILIINQNQGFAITVKRALEAADDFVVHVFTELDAALEFLHDEPQDLALVDLALPGRDDVVIVHSLRAAQPGLPIIASPRYQDVDAAMRAMNLQGMLDAPFNVRNVIPLIEDTIEQMGLDDDIPAAPDTLPEVFEAPLTAAPARPPVEDATPIEDDMMWMYDLDEKEQPTPDDTAGDESGFLGNFDILDPALLELAEADTAEIEALEEVMRADDGPPPWEQQDRDPSGTHILDSTAREDDLAAPGITFPADDPMGTGMLDDSYTPDSDQPAPISFDSDDPMSTGILGDGQTPDGGGDDPLGTRILSDDLEPEGAAPGTLIFDSEYDGEPFAVDDIDPDQTGELGDDISTQDPGQIQTDLLPESQQFSSLETVLSDLDEFMMDEPPPDVEDTPDVPPPSSEDAFSELVDSMRREPEQRRLTDRHRDRDFMEFILSGGAMDDMLTEIREREGTGELTESYQRAKDATEEHEPVAPAKPVAPVEPVDTFDFLASVEPPVPDFEESGTVGDLIMGVEDTGFKNVLAILRGEVAEDEAPSDVQPSLTQEEMEDAFADFYQSKRDTRKPEPSADRAFDDEDDDRDVIPDYAMAFMDASEDDDEPTPAEVVLKTTFEDSSEGDAFSVDDLIASIERQLPQHRPRIKPLPSWLEDSRPMILGDQFAEVQPPQPTQLPEMPVEYPQLDEIVGQVEEPEVDAWLNPPDLEEDQRIDEDISDTTRPHVLPAEMRPEVDSDDYFDEIPDAEQIDSVLPELELNEFFDDSSSHDDAAIFEMDADAALDRAYVPDDSLASDMVNDFEVDEPVLEAHDAPLDDGQWDEAAEADWDAPDDRQPDIQALPESLPEVRNVHQLPDWWRGADDDQSDEYVDDLDDAEQAADSVDVEQPPESLPEFDQPDVVEEWDFDTDEEAVESPPETVPEFDTSAADDLWAEADEYAAAEPDVETLMETGFELDVFEDDGDDTQLIEEPTVPGQAVREAAREPVAAAHIPMIADGEEIDPRVAHLAVQLTQFSLESTAIATLLTHRTHLIAYAGDMTDDEVAELNEYFIPHDWKADPEGASIRFVRLESSGKGYMLYSRLSEDQFTLSMVFDGATPLRVIRRQGRRLAGALDAVPEEALEEMTQAVEATRPVVVEAPPEPAEAVSMIAYAYLWLLRDPDATFDPIMAQTMRTALSVQLSEQGWDIHRLDVTEDFVYLLADVPGETPPHRIMRDLKQRSAQIVQGGMNGDVNPDTTWADGYLIITPGRELEPEEIQEFIHFQRML